MISTSIHKEKAVDFAFSTRYKGKKVILSIIPAGNRFAVFSNDRLLGHIKIGRDRHTWYVAESEYVAYDVVEDIAKRIKAEFLSYKSSSI